MVDAFNPTKTVTRPTQANADNKDQIHVQLHQELPDAVGELRTGLSLAITQINTELAGKVASSGFTEAAQDATAAMFRAGSNVTIAYDDAANTFTINAVATGGTSDPEAIRDTIGGALVGGTGVQITVDDAGDTITLAVAGIPAAAITTGQFAVARLGTGTPTSSTVLTGDGAWTTPGKALVGLGNVDNTSDVNKPVSTAQATELNKKVNVADIAAATDVVTATSLTTTLTPYSKTADLPNFGAFTKTADLSDIYTRLAALESNAGQTPSSRPVRPSTSAQPSFWLRGDQITQSGGTISNWSDTIGSIGFAVPSGLSAPTYSATAVKGKPGAVFTRSGSSRLYYPKATKPENQTIFVVFSVAALNAAQGLIQATDTAGAAVTLAVNTYLASANNTVAAMQGNTGANAFAGTTLSAAGAAIGRFTYGIGAGVGTSSAKTLSSSLNGGTIGTSQTQVFTAGSTAGFALGGAGGGDVNIAEVIIFDSELSAADKVTWTQYLGTTYGITIGSN